jgi:murein DD-endopeptidase MepM/ murein hydrolase activator NlpD
VAAQNEDQVKDDALSLSQVLESVRERKPRFTLAIIDACRDNPFVGTGRAIGGRGLTGVAGASGQMVIYAAGEGQRALDRLGNSDTVRNGLFTRVFLKEISQPGVPIRDVLYRVRDEVATLAESVRHEQVPAVYDQVRGTFYFIAPTPAAPTAVAIAPPAAAVATLPVPGPARIEPAHTDGQAALAFQWPVAGPVLANFKEGVSKALVVGGPAGTSVQAAADGKVVYAGSGLRGYGKLVLIKHDQSFLTAYAHNRALLVEEGQTVKRGQPIAEMGSTDADRVQLGFEIRLLGKAVDPLIYLPHRP